MVALFRVLWLPTLSVLAVLAWLWLDSAFGWRGVHLPWLGAPLVLAGTLLIAWCFSLLAWIGKGSPHPFTAKTKRLVIVGPYRRVRNPMMYGVGAILVGLALWLGSVGLWLGFACFVFYVRWFVRAYEVPDMERRFGEEYREYCRQVPRWWPRLRSR